MNSPSHWLDNPRNVKRVWRGFLVVLICSVLAELAITLHPHFWIESLPAFHAFYGFLACAAMIFAAKAIGALLKRPDNYYKVEDDE